MLLKCAVFWKVTPCILVDSYHRSGRNCCLVGQRGSHPQYGSGRFLRNHDVRVHTYIRIYIPWIHNFVTTQEDVE
jgi:hypothetical protein